MQHEWVKTAELRYGENPHQKAAFYREPLADGPSVASAEQLQGKALNGSHSSPSPLSSTRSNAIR